MTMLRARVVGALSWVDVSNAAARSLQGRARLGLLGRLHAGERAAVVVEGVPDAPAVARALDTSGIPAVGDGTTLVLPQSFPAIRDAEVNALVRGLAEEVRRAETAYQGGPDNLVWRSRVLPLKMRPQVMGILNVTPDSFSDGGRYVDPKRAIDHAVQMVEDGAGIIDVGGESTRPGAEPVDAKEEMRRVVPVIEAIAAVLPVPVSIDTWKSEVARAALDAGASMLNDVSAGRFDPEILSLAADRDVPLILMHMRGDPRTMQQDPSYRDVVSEVHAFLGERADAAVDAGVKPTRLLVDPGFGFGKTPQHNLVLLRRLRELTSLGFPVVAGTSRKSFIGATLDLPLEERLEGTAATVALAVANGATIIRVHDVRAMRRVVDMVGAVLRAEDPGAREDQGDR